MSERTKEYKKLWMRWRRHPEIYERPSAKQNGRPRSIGLRLWAAKRKKNFKPTTNVSLPFIKPLGDENESWYQDVVKKNSGKVFSYASALPKPTEMPTRPKKRMKWVEGRLVPKTKKNPPAVKI